MGASSLLIDEWFATGDERFVQELLSCSDGGKLKSLAPKWAGDQRAFARDSQIAWLAAGGADRASHRPLAKTLFKAAETAGDDVLVGHFMVAFDRFAYRRLVKRWSYDWKSKTTTVGEQLDYVKGILARRPKDLSKLQKWQRPRYEENKRFSRATRRYLQRRAWRYFRKLARKEPDRYVKAITPALKLYPESAVDNVAGLFDAWGLMNALFHGSKALERHARGVKLASGQTLATLEPAPFAAELWKKHFDPLLELFIDGRCNTVRQWALKSIRRDHLAVLKSVPLDVVKKLLRSAREDAQTLGGELLRSAPGLDALPISDWLEMLRLDNPAALLPIVELMKKHVAPERLSTAQCVELCASKIAGVAQLGFDWAKARPVRAEGDLDPLLPMAAASVDSVRKAAVEWLASLLLLNDGPKMAARVRELLDSKYADVRAKALELMAKDARFGESRLLWAAMIESPWADVREALVPVLQKREGAYEAHELRSLWATSLLAIHRGGRAKSTVARQVADRIVRVPAEAESLLPLLGLALRSVRPPERRSALAAITRAAVRAPALRASVEKLLPELKLGLEVAA